MAKMKATCVRRTHHDERLTHTYYRISGGNGVQGPGSKYYRDVVVSSAVVAADTVERWRNETLIFAANKDGRIKHTSSGRLITLGGEAGTTSASAVLKRVGVTEITSCATGPSRFDARKRRRKRRSR